MGALDAAVRQGKALYVGISSYSARAHRARPRAILRDLGTPLLIHQPSYSMLNRWIEDRLLDALERGAASAASRSRRSRRACSPTRYLDGVPADSRAARGGSCSRSCSRRRTWTESAAWTRSPSARPDPRPAGARLGAARPAHDLGADRRQQRRAARRQRRRARATSTSATTSCRDRPHAGERLSQPLGFLERRLTDELAEGLRPVPPPGEPIPRRAPPGRVARSPAPAPP